MALVFFIEETGMLEGDGCRKIKEGYRESS